MKRFNPRLLSRKYPDSISALKEIIKVYISYCEKFCGSIGEVRTVHMPSINGAHPVSCVRFSDGSGFDVVEYAHEQDIHIIVRFSRVEPHVLGGTIASSGYMFCGKTNKILI
jgi:hypothetical protein